MNTQVKRTKILTFQGYNPKVRRRYSSKFYKMFQSCREINITFGKIGSAGQTLRKFFPTSAAASDFFDAKLLEKIVKGYQFA